jgi:tmRNA-binding protein
MESITTNQINKEIEEFIEGDYITIREGESRVLEFDINELKLVDRTDFNGNPLRKVQFIVIDPQDQQRREKKFELSKKHVPKIYNELKKKGKTVLEIFRTGLGKQTEYHVKAVG